MDSLVANNFDCSSQAHFAHLLLLVVVIFGFSFHNFISIFLIVLGALLRRRILFGFFSCFSWGRNRFIDDLRGVSRWLERWLHVGLNGFIFYFIDFLQGRRRHFFALRLRTSFHRSDLS